MYKSLRFFLPPLLTAAVTLPLFTTANAGAESRYVAAAAVSELVENLKAAIIPTELKTALLKNVRTDDKVFSTDVIIHWKTYTDRNFHAEFDALVVDGDSKAEALRLQLVDATTNTYVINGRVWVMPKNGSIEKSLRIFFSETGTSAHREPRATSVFGAILSPAVAAAEDFTVVQRNAAITFLYVYKTAEGSKLIPTKEAVASASDHLVKSLLNKYFGTSIKVRCNGLVARGDMVIDGHKVGFESQAPGVLLLTTDNPIKSKVLVQAKAQISNGVIVVHEELRTVACLNADCSKVSTDTNHETPLPWLVHEKPLSEFDTYIAETKAKQAIMAIRPLGACCLQESCRKSLEEKNVNLIRDASGGGGISQ